MKTALVPLCAALLLLPATAFAQPTTDGEKTWIDNDEGATVTQKDDGTRVVVIDDDDEVVGDRLNPEGVQLHGVNAVVHRSMISVRGQFLPELIQLSLDI